MKATLYTKPDCPLCDKLNADLLLIRQEVGLVLEVEERNIEEDAEAHDRFQYLVPVLDIEDGPTLYPPHAMHELLIAFGIA